MATRLFSTYRDMGQAKEETWAKQKQTQRTTTAH